MGVNEIEEKINLGYESQEENLGNLIVSLSKLESRGLIGETADPKKKAINIRRSDDKSTLSWDKRWRTKSLELLPVGISFLKMAQGNGI